MKVDWQGKTWTMFAPNGSIKEGRVYFTWYAERINASGWRPWPFPSNTMMTATHCGGAFLNSITWHDVDLSYACMSEAYLAQSWLQFVEAKYADFTDSVLTNTTFLNSDLTHADFAGVLLSAPDAKFDLPTEIVDTIIHQTVFTDTQGNREILGRRDNQGEPVWVKHD